MKEKKIKSNSQRVLLFMCEWQQFNYGTSRDDKQHVCCSFLF